MTHGDKELDGKVAIVTGSSTNIGRAIALAFAEGGAAVVVNAMTSAAEAEDVSREVEARGGRALVHMADVTDPSAVEALVDNTVQTFGKLDILVWQRRLPVQRNDLRDLPRGLQQGTERHGRHHLSLRQGRLAPSHAERCRGDHLHRWSFRPHGRRGPHRRVRR